MKRNDKYCKCKKCGGMAIIDKSNILMSYPPKYAYKCLKCGGTGYVEYDR